MAHPRLRALLRARPDLPATRHHRQTLAFPYQTQPLGLCRACVTHSSADYEIVDGRPRRRRRRPLTRGLNRNYNRVLKGVFKGAANAATGRPGPFLNFYQELLVRGMREELARVTLARKIAALTLRIWKTGELFDPTQLTQLQQQQRR